jgi:benzoyl-CoA reductase/2-hydroxyglutaryl-CoA dehydratase subunit BcrC/BadD/HgdB
MLTLDLPHRSEIIRAHKANGGPIAAVLPIHYPRALLRAFNILPIEVWGPPRIDPMLGTAHLQPYVCSIVRNALAFLLNGGLDAVDCIVVPHTCDSLQGFASILIDFVKPKQPVLPIYLPRGKRDSDLQFLAAEFRALYDKLSALTHRQPTNDDLMHAIEREEQADDLLGQLHRHRQKVALSQIDLYRLLRSREYLPAESFL